MAEAHDRCQNPLCSLGRAHVGGCTIGGVMQALADGAPSGFYGVSREQPARQPMPAASPLAVEARSVEQYLLDLEAEAREADERIRSDQRLAHDLRAMARHLRLWLAKIPSAPTGVGSTGRGSNP
jgi:hypothetical protein